MWKIVLRKAKRNQNRATDVFGGRQKARLAMKNDSREGNDPRKRLFSTEEQDGVAVLTFCDQIQTLLGMDLTLIETLWEFFVEQERRPAKAIVLHLPTSALGPEGMDRVLAAHGIRSDGHAHGRGFLDLTAFERQKNAARRFIQMVRNTESVVILTLSGSMLLPLFGPALACDFRVASEDFMLLNRMADYFVAPFGGLPWFLARVVGRDKANELMQQSKGIPASEAMQMGLVEKVVPRDALLDAAVALAQDIAARPYGNREAIKQTSAVAGDSLEAYMEQEEQLFKKSLAKLRSAESSE